MKRAILIPTALIICIFGATGWFFIHEDLEISQAAPDYPSGKNITEIDHQLQSVNAEIAEMEFTIEELEHTLRTKDKTAADLAIDFSEPPDQTPPTTTISLSGTAGDNGWYVSDVEVTLSAVDTGGSGVAEIKYSLDGGDIWNVYSAPFTITAEGTNMVLARAWDNAGNDEGPPVSVNIKIDQTPPALTLTVDPDDILSMSKGTTAFIDYTGDAVDPLSKLFSTNTILIDEYGQLDRDLGPATVGTTPVEAWSRGQGRTYTFRLTARDYAGNEASIDAITNVHR